MTNSTVQTSTVGVPFPMVRAIHAMEETPVGFIKDWQSINDNQKIFLEKFFNPTRMESLTIEELEAIASADEKVINKFLSERGFSIQLDPLGPDEYCAASVLDYPWKWKFPGEEIQICRKREGSTYSDLHPGIAFDNRAGTLSFQHAEGSAVWDIPIIRLETQTDDVVWMAVIGSIPIIDYDVVLHAQTIQSLAKPTKDDHPFNKYDAVHFPMVDLDIESDVKYLIGMWGQGPNGKATIIQAMQQTKLKMNEVGGRCKSAAAVAVFLESCAAGPSNPYIINEPFLMWVERPGLSQPLFAHYLCPEVWKAPADLD